MTLILRIWNAVSGRGLRGCAARNDAAADRLDAALREILRP